MREKFNSFIKSCATRTVPSIGTKSTGLQANARGVMVFATPSRLFHSVPGLTILTRTWYHGTISSCTQTLQPSARTCKNHATATQTATHQTAGPLGCNNSLYPHLPACTTMCLRLYQDSLIIRD